MRPHGTKFIGLVALAVAATMFLAACGDDDDDDTASAAASDSAPVATQAIDGTDVLVDSDGRALYSAEQEQDGTIVCTQSCTDIWDPVLVSELDADPSTISGDFGTVDRPDGGKQLTFDGAPLYSFTEEGPGELTGDGFADNFDGTDFTWNAAGTDAAAGSDSSESSDSSDGGGSYGGY